MRSVTQRCLPSFSSDSMPLPAIGNADAAVTDPGAQVAAVVDLVRVQLLNAAPRSAPLRLDQRPQLVWHQPQWQLVHHDDSDQAEPT